MATVVCEEFVAMSLSPLMHAGGQWMNWGTLFGGGRVVLYDEPHLDLGAVLDLVEARAHRHGEPHR